MTTPPRTWSAHGHRNTHTPGEYLYIENHPRAAAMYGPDALPLLLTENPDGNYLGWQATGETELGLVQWHTLFNMQFPYGAQAEADLGRGTIVRLSVTELDPDEDALPTHWHMYAHATVEGGYLHVNARASRTALYSAKIPVVPVTVTPNERGQYTGWITTGATTPTHITRDHIFDIQFAYGHQVEQDAGKGQAIPLSITPGHTSSRA